MSQKTDSPEFAPGFLWQIVLLTIAALCVVLVSHGTLTWRLTTGPRLDGVSVPITLYPWVYGGGWTIENGLRAFSGKVPEPPPASLRAATLILVLISLVVCPTLFLLEWRRRRSANAPFSERSPLRISSIFYALCGTITIVAGVGLGPVAYFSETTRANLRHAQAIQSNKDAMINELNMLAVDATQYFILPKTIGGGGQSFEGYSVLEKLAKSEEASYIVSGGQKAATFHATSARFPSCTIDVKVDSVGRMGWWTYEGEFK
jgi:hypothetical protein